MYCMSFPDTGYTEDMPALRVCANIRHSRSYTMLVSQSYRDVWSSRLFSITCFHVSSQPPSGDIGRRTPEGSVLNTRQMGRMAATHSKYACRNVVNQLESMPIDESC